LTACSSPRPWTRLRRALFDRLLHLPLPALWDMKTGGILSRLSGDVDTTPGSCSWPSCRPLILIIRLIIAVEVL
jgi:ATP-binding cassette subfamily B protein/subfamily B ATP-binding cassette protein MsbA